MRKPIALALTALIGTALLAPVAQADSCGQLSDGWVVTENARQGDLTWNQGVPFRFSADFSRRKNLDRAEGYFDTTSLRCGATAKLTLVGVAKAKVTVYRKRLEFCCNGKVFAGAVPIQIAGA